MKQYREKLKVQNVVLSIGSLILAVFAVLAAGSELDLFTILPPSVGDEHWQSAWYGFITGSSFGLLAVMIFCLIRNCRAMRDEKKLKALYVKANDERTLKIQTLAQSSAMQILLWIGIVATVIAGYFNVTVSLTILICTFASSCISIILTVYYNEKL